MCVLEYGVRKLKSSDTTYIPYQQQSLLRVCRSEGQTDRNAHLIESLSLSVSNYPTVNTESLLIAS